MKFCPFCNNMLYPKEVSRSLSFCCRRCEHVQEADGDFIVHRNEIKHTELEKTWVASDVATDPTLPRTKRTVCQRCNGNEAVFFRAQKLGTSSGMTLYFVCTNAGCNHRWKDNSGS